MIRPRLNALRTFDAAGSKLSFSLAADDLNISQAAVSQQIRQLEAYLGEPLFIRQHRRITLTALGRTYWKAVHDALEQLDGVTDRLFAVSIGHRVVIRCNSSVATLWLAPNIRAFQAENPEIDLHIETQEHDGSTNANIEIFVSDKTDHGPHVVPLLTAKITPVAAPEYIAENPPLQPQDILDYNLIHIIGYDDDWHRWFRTYDLDLRSIPRGLSADSSLFAIDAALRGDGVFLGRRPFIDSYLKSGKLVEVFQEPHYLSANYYLSREQNVRKDKSSDKVCAWLTDL